MAKKKKDFTIVGEIDTKGKFKSYAGTPQETIERRAKAYNAYKNNDIGVNETVQVGKNKTKNLSTTLSRNVIRTTNDDGYTDTRRKYGQYFSGDKEKDNYTIYQKDGKYYYQNPNDNSYNEITGQIEQKKTVKEKINNKKPIQNNNSSLQQGLNYNPRGLNYNPKEETKYKTKEIITKKNVADLIKKDMEQDDEDQYQRWRESLSKEDRDSILQSKKYEKEKTENEYNKANTKWKNKVLDNRNDKTKQMLSYSDKMKDSNVIEDSNKAYEKAKKEYKTKENKRNKYALANYNYNVEKYSDDNYNPNPFEKFYDQTIGRGVRGVGDMLLNFSGREGEKYVDENGKITYLPSELEIKNQAVRKTYGNDALGKLGAFTGDTIEGVSKIGAAIGLDALTYGVGGTFLYNNDMAKTAYKNAINQGATEQQAMANAAISTGSELLTGKLLGSATKGLTKLGGNTIAENAAGSAFENLLEKGISKKIKNKALSKMLAASGSEATEEFMQEYIDALNNKLTLGQEIDLGETTKNALYSGALGGVTGGIVNAPTAIKINNNQRLMKIQANQVQQQVQKGEISPQQGMVALEQIQKGTYEQNQTLEAIAQQKVKEVQQAVNEGAITSQEAAQEVQAITQTLQQQRSKINDIEMNRNATNYNIDNSIESMRKQTKSNVENYINDYNQNLNDAKTQEQLDNLSKQVDELKQNNNKVIENFKSASNSVDRNSVLDYSNVLNIPIKSGSSIIENTNMSKLSGKNKTPSIIDIGDPIIEVNNKNRKQIRKSILENFIRRFNNKEITIYDTNTNAMVGKSGIEKTLSGAITTEKVKSMDKLDNIVANGIYKYTTADTNDANGILYHHFITPVRYKGSNEVIRTVIKEYTKNPKLKDKYYYHQMELLDKKKTEDSTLYRSKSEYKAQEPSVSKNNISKINKNVKSDISTNSNMQEEKNNSKLNENKSNAEEVLRINNDGTSEVLSDRPEISGKYSTKEKVKKTLRDEAIEMAIKFTNINAELDRISKKTKNPMLKTETDRMGIAISEANQNIEKSQRDLNGVLYKNFTDKDGNKVSMSVESIWKEANKEGIDNKTLDEYLISYLNLDRLEQGVDQFNIPAYESEETIKKIEKQYPDIKRIAGNIWQYQKNQLQKKVDAGLVSKDSQEYFDTNTPHYVRIQRKVDRKGSTISSAFNGNITMKNTIQKVKGGLDAIQSIRETMAQYEIESTLAIRKNRVLQELANSLNYGEESDMVSIDGDLNINPELIVKNKDNTYTATFFKDGKAVQIPINEYIYEAMNGQQIKDWENWMIMKIPREISTIQRALLTDKNPIFMITNFFKDYGDALLNTKYSSATFMKNRPRAVLDLLGKDGGKYSKLFEALGGGDNSYFRDGKFINESKSKISKVVDKALSPITVGNEFIERVPRLTEFISTIEKNGYTVNENGELIARKGKNPTKSSQEVLSEALYNAAEITTNFKRGGTVTKALNRNGATFLNASVQGFSKQIRNFTEIKNPKQAVSYLSKVVMLGIAPALINDIMYDDDDEYADLPDYIKDQYYLFKGEDDKWIRIPKGRALSVFGSAARYTKEVSKGNISIGEALKGWKELSINQIAPNNPLENNVLSPLVSAATNKSWNGSKIVSDSIANPNHPEEEFDAKTDEFSKWLGKQLGLSPKKINYVLDQYTGGIGDVALPFMTNYAEGDEDSVVGKIFINPLKSKFTTDSVMNNKSVSEFYDTVEKLENEKKYSKATVKDKAKYSYLYSASMGISELYKEQKEIQNDTSLKDSEKNQQVKEKQKEIISAMKEAMDNVRNASSNDGLIQIGDSYYREKIEDGVKKASKINDKTISKANEYDIDIKTYATAVKDIYNIHNIKNENGKVVKTRRQQIYEYINELPLSAAEKQRLFSKYYKK